MSDKPKRAFELIGVGRYINCSSSADHFVNVAYRYKGRPFTGSYHFEGDALAGARVFELRIPAYLRRAIHAALLAVLTGGEARYYEYNQDGIERYKDLRYHRPDWEEHAINTLKRRGNSE